MRGNFISCTNLDNILVTTVPKKVLLDEQNILICRKYCSELHLVQEKSFKYIQEFLEE